ncbi:pentatricopeptide repeat-containing protein 5, mitochondrial [Rhizoctonia solani]|uniref:Pentatricopeptide repeat-containing protein 5, mitochondrial n=1 Tax=Rhizoctonia solani TaxID=456999 RepID=A0A8H8P3L4_9AGAM|nr:pentatricopeptide repeat-containing protein 5, mitochondrial [Rhizoctonia solani]QRW24515.1 pentatricopeptide repeat-containing protein 5, mitochondrial [Rhizoctonia solani]
MDPLDHNHLVTFLSEALLLIPHGPYKTLQIHSAPFSIKNPPVRSALLHKPYIDLSEAIVTYRTANIDPLDLTLTRNGIEKTIIRLAGDSHIQNDPFAYLSGLLQTLTSAKYPTPEDLELALRVYAEMRPSFGRKPTRDDTLCLARARAMLRQPVEALEIVTTLAPPPEPDSDVWPLIACAIVLVSEDRGRNSADEVRALIQKMADIGVERLLEPESVGKEPRVWSTALEVLLNSDNQELRKEVAEKLEKIVGTQNITDTHVWASLMVYVGRVESQKDKNAPYEVLRAFDAAGDCRIPKLENEIGVPADDLAWGVIVDAAIERIGEQVGPETEDTGIVGVWTAASESGVNLTSTVLDRVVAREDIPIIDRLWAYKVVHAAWPVDKEKDRPEGEEGTNIDKWMRREDAITVPGPTVRTYSALLRALASRKGNELNRISASTAAVELLTDMRQRGIKFPQIAQAPTTPRSGNAIRQTAAPAPLSALASLTILLMQNAPSHEAAFKTYAYACVIDPNSGSFGEREYRAILKAFAGLKIPRDVDELLRQGGEELRYMRLLLRHYYEIMRDMQRAGYVIQPAEYSTVLRAYANSSLDPPGEFEPTSSLLNSLMLAYGRVSALDSVLAIWERIRDRGWDNASASIVIDALGRSGRSNLQRARMIWDTLRRRHGSKLTVNNYTAWVETLCRLGEFSEAERVVFIDMRGNIKPDEKTLRTLVSFAWRTGRQAKVLEDIATLSSVTTRRSSGLCVIYLLLVYILVRLSAASVMDPYAGASTGSLFAPLPKAYPSTRLSPSILTHRQGSNSPMPARPDSLDDPFFTPNSMIQSAPIPHTSVPFAPTELAVLQRWSQVYHSHRARCPVGPPPGMPAAVYEIFERLGGAAPFAGQQVVTSTTVADFSQDPASATSSQNTSTTVDEAEPFRPEAWSSGTAIDSQPTPGLYRSPEGDAASIPSSSPTNTIRSTGSARPAHVFGAGAGMRVGSSPSYGALDQHMRALELKRGMKKNAAPMRAASGSRPSSSVRSSPLVGMKSSTPSRQSSPLVGLSGADGQPAFEPMGFQTFGTQLAVQQATVYGSADAQQQSFSFAAGYDADQSYTEAPSTILDAQGKAEEEGDSTAQQQSCTGEGGGRGREIDHCWAVIGCGDDLLPIPPNLSTAAVSAGSEGGNIAPAKEKAKSRATVAASDRTTQIR